MEKYSYLLKAAAIASCVLLASCGDNSGETTRSEDQHANLIMLSDSIGYANPHFLEKCDSLMAQSRDSMDYYEIYATKGMRYTVADPADSMLHYADRILRWANTNEKKSPRLSGIESRGYALKASYYHIMRQNPDSAIQLFSKAYIKAMDSDINYNAPNLAANLGDAYVFKDDLPNAAHWYRRALYVADSLNLPVMSIVFNDTATTEIYTCPG